jgi:hypothetical protein
MEENPVRNMKLNSFQPDFLRLLLSSDNTVKYLTCLFHKDDTLKGKLCYPNFVFVIRRL